MTNNRVCRYEGNPFHGVPKSISIFIDFITAAFRPDGNIQLGSAVMTSYVITTQVGRV